MNCPAARTPPCPQRAGCAPDRRRPESGGRWAHVRSCCSGRAAAHPRRADVPRKRHEMRRCDHARPPVDPQLEVLRAQPLDRAPLVVQHRGVHSDQVDPGAKDRRAYRRRRLLRQCRKWREDERSRKDDGAHGRTAGSYTTPGRGSRFVTVSDSGGYGPAPRGRTPTPERYPHPPRLSPSSPS